ncbi:MAG: J domain-containing protein [Actinobacteria bacterium]|nr:J domain-containing protein [Actinomycetota bacterium]
MQGSDVTHYEVLGVDPTASDAEIRRAYLEAARRSHPDVAGDAGEERMRQINEAWATLSDPEARALYDHIRPLSPGEQERFAAGDRNGWSGPTPPPRINNPPKTEFVPLFATDADDDDSWRYEPDPVDERTALDAKLQLVPPLLLSGGLLSVIIGAVISLKALLALGLSFGVLGLVSFLALPILAMGKAKSAERSTPKR